MEVRDVVEVRDIVEKKCGHMEGHVLTRIEPMDDVIVINIIRYNGRLNALLTA